MEKNLEDGRVSFLENCQENLHQMIFSRILKSKNIFILGNSGSGKSTLAAKLASYLSDAKNTKKLIFLRLLTQVPGILMY